MFLYVTLYHTPLHTKLFLHLCLTIYAAAGRLSSSSRSLPPVPPADPLTGHFKYVTALAEDRKNEMEAYPSAGQNSNTTPVSIYKHKQSVVCTVTKNENMYTPYTI